MAKTADVPLLEPDSAQEAKEMVKWAFELSEQFGIYFFLRTVTRVSHASGNVTLGELPKQKRKAHFDTSTGFFGTMPVPPKHRAVHDKLDKIQEIYETSPFNWYQGPEHPELLIVCCGTGSVYSQDAIEELGVEKAVGILKIGTTWPLPRKFIEKNLARAKQVLVVEEVDPFLETHLKEIVYDSPEATGSPKIYGATTGHLEPVGELTPDLVAKALSHILDLEYWARDPDYDRKAVEAANKMVVPRGLAWCPGCPHRATFWAIKNALRLEGGDGFVTGDVGCYLMDRRPEAYQTIKTGHSMGSGTGLASGFGKLGQFGFDQPVISSCGDSTFFHSVMPALVNAVHNQSDIIIGVLDNSATAMTGFQPHPGTDRNAIGDPAPVVDIEALCRSVGAEVVVVDPYDVKDTQEKILKLLDGKGPRILISRRKCALIRMREEGALYKVRVDPEKCIGEACGCARFCTLAFKCPALIWDKEAGKARVEESVCTGCGVCTDICPQGAIVKEAVVKEAA